ncbi:MAG: hypothetical protein ACE5RN_07245 [Nitrosopumilaceae archaeon]
MEIEKKQIFSKDSSGIIFLFSNLVISFGILLVTVGGEWDITNHLLNKPETFLSPPHALLYSGVAIALIGTVIMFTRWYKFTEEKKSSYRFPVKLGIIGIFILVAAGPLDFVWHDNFGLDGLLSPPHQTLLSGMFLCAIASMISILRYGQAQKAKSYTIHHFMIVLAVLPVWLVASGFLYSFSLPFSDTDYFDFNPEVYFAVVFATISMPFLTSVILILSSRLANYKFGILTITGIILLIINASTSIMPNPALIDTVPFYLLTVIPFILADLILATTQRRATIYAAGAIIASTFYFLYFPLVTHVYNEVIFDRVVSGSMTSNVYFEMMSVVFPIIIGPAIVLGVIGATFANKIFLKILN